MTTAEAIKAIREKMGLSQQKFSERLNSTLMTVSRWERDLYTPTPQMLAELVELATENGLKEAADALGMEKGAALQILGPRMLNKADERLGQIASNILEFRHRMKKADLTIPDDIWNDCLDHALYLTKLIKDDLKQLTSMAHFGPKA